MHIHILQDSLSEHPTKAYERPRWWFGFSLYAMNVLFNFALSV